MLVPQQSMLQSAPKLTSDLAVWCGVFESGFDAFQAASPPVSEARNHPLYSVQRPRLINFGVGTWPLNILSTYQISFQLLL